MRLQGDLYSVAAAAAAPEAHLAAAEKRPAALPDPNLEAPLEGPPRHW